MLLKGVRLAYTLKLQLLSNKNDMSSLLKYFKIFREVQMQHIEKTKIPLDMIAEKTVQRLYYLLTIITIIVSNIDNICQELKKQRLACRISPCVSQVCTVWAARRENGSTNLFLPTGQHFLLLQILK